MNSSNDKNCQERAQLISSCLKNTSSHKQHKNSVSISKCGCINYLFITDFIMSNKESMFQRTHQTNQMVRNTRYT